MRDGSRGNLTGYLLFLVTVALVGGELLARWIVPQPTQDRPLAVEVSPGGRLFEADEDVGYRLLPGVFRVKIAHGGVFSVTHLPNSRRATTAAATPPEAAHAVWIFGCSFTYGWGVNDADTYPWQLQRDRPHLAVSNFGVPGFSTVQSLLQLRAALQREPPPEIVVLGYASFHAQRNVLDPGYRATLSAVNRLGIASYPFARLDGDGTVVVERTTIAPDAGVLVAHSRLAYALDEAARRYQMRGQDARAVTIAVLRAFERTAADAGARVVIAGVSPDGETLGVLDEIRTAGVTAVNIAPPVLKQNAADWSHPGPDDHHTYADTLAKSVDEIVSGG
jgi:non-ribosomal peptide synthetase component F